MASLAWQCHRSMALIYDVNVDLEIWEENPTNKKKLLKLVCEFESYIRANGGFIPNYGDRYRHNETIKQQKNIFFCFFLFLDIIQ